jgi:uncharacterized membrane protein YeaQ/YmgE (transglycosylase-associated protein family)
MLTVNLPIDNLLIWILVGLVAGFLASHVVLGYGLGLFADVLVGIIGAILGPVIANYVGFSVTVPGHQLISEMIIAFIGAMILLLILRLFGLGARRRAF